jgi:hypothetical protein
VRLNFKRKTVGLRHGIVKLLAPKLYSNMMSILEQINGTPRPMTLFMKEYFKTSQLVGAEIGVFKGDNALNILQELQIKKLFLIDPYLPYMEGDTQVFPEEAETARQKLSQYNQAVFIKKMSADAVKDISEPLDFVYIDGNHDYEHVKLDIKLYYPLVKQAGVVGGHDYYVNHNFGVVQAVNVFALKHGNFYIASPDWWLIKKKAET